MRFGCFPNLVFFSYAFKAETEDDGNGRQVQEEGTDFLHNVTESGSPHDDVPDEMKFPGKREEMGQDFHPFRNEN